MLGYTIYSAWSAEQFTFSDVGKVNCWYDLLIFRENRSSRSSLFDGYDAIEEGGLKASSSYSSDIIEHENEKDLDSLKDKVFFLKQVRMILEFLSQMSIQVALLLCFIILTRIVIATQAWL